MKTIHSIFIRYIILVILGIPNLFVFYFIFTPLTVYPVFFLSDILYNANLLPGNIISLQGILVNIIPACIAGAAYYFLLILNLTTPMHLKKRIQSILFLFLMFLILNIIRIIIFINLALNKVQYFDLAHKTTWYIGSTILLIIIWFVNLSIFKIQSIPVITDLKSIKRHIRK